jgi:hypothetical protein
MEFKDVVTRPRIVRHIIIRPDPPHRQQIDQVRVPEGGAGWVFILTAAITIGWAVIKRYSERNSVPVRAN